MNRTTKARCEMKYQCIYYIYKYEFPETEDIRKVLDSLPKEIKVLACLTGNAKVDRFIISNIRHRIYRIIARQAMLEAEIKKELYHIFILGTNEPQKKGVGR